MREAYDYLEYAIAEATERMQLLSLCLSPTAKIMLCAIVENLLYAMTTADKMAGLWEEA